MHEFESRRVALGETTVEVLEAGAGAATFVCTHPYLDTTGPHPAGALTDALADAGRTFYLVPRGTGGSDPEDDPAKLGVMQTVEDLDAVRTALGIESWVVCGASTGGMTAVEYACRYPAATRGFVSVGGAASWKFLEDPACIYNPAHPEAWREEEARLALDGSEDANRRWIMTVLELSLERTDLLERMAARSTISGPRLERVREELIGRWDREDDLTGLEMPALIACGRHDTQCPIAASLLMAERLPAARLAIFEHSNHFPYEEEPDAFRRAVLDFAATVEG
jgi:proline iminopeptidase